MRAIDAALEVVNLSFKTLDFSVASLKVLVETIALSNKLLLPLSETLLLNLDLLSEALAKRLLLLLELGVVQPPRTSLADLPCLHLLCPVCLVMVLLGGVDQVQHMSSNQDGAELLEVTMLLVFNLSNTPSILSALDGSAVVGLNVLLRSDDREGHGINQTTCMLHSGGIVILERRSVNLDALSINDLTHLSLVSEMLQATVSKSYSRLEFHQVCRTECVRFRDNWDKIDASAELLHHLNVQWLKGVAGGTDEIETRMDTKIDLVGTTGLLFL